MAKIMRPTASEQLMIDRRLREQRLKREAARAKRRVVSRLTSRPVKMAST